MLNKFLKIVGGYCIAKTIFVIGKNYGEAKTALSMIKNEANNLRSNLRDREESRNYA